jgi:outer membrane protein assembly factor BamB
MLTCLWLLLPGYVCAQPRVTFHRAPKPLHRDAVTHDWPSFLGPTHDAVSTETHLLHALPDGGPAIVWEVRKGTGYSSPAIAGNRLVLFHRMGDEEIVDCFEATTGRLFWEHRYATTYRDRYGYNNGPRASPVIAADRVFTIGAQAKLHCLSLATGDVLWQRDLAADYQLKQDFFGVASTPLVDGERLIINIGAPGGPNVVAIDVATGAEQWRAGDQWGASYASPVPAVIHGQRRVLVFAGGESRPPTGGLLAINPADGSIHLRYPWRSEMYESVNASNPVAVGSNVFISATYQTGSAMLEVKPDGTHDVAWTTGEVGTHFGTMIHRDGYLYGCDGRNIPDASMVCVDAATGRVVWRQTPMWTETIERRGRPAEQKVGIFRGSMLWADGQFLCLGELGHLLWLDLSPNGYRQVSRAWLFAAPETWSVPVLSRGLLYVCQHQRDVLSGNEPRMICYDLRGAATQTVE